MNAYIFTFGSSHLNEISLRVSPMKVMLIIEAESEHEAREIVFDSFIGDRFCTSYPISMQTRFTTLHGMVPYRLRELQGIYNSVIVNSHLR